ncbi:MAG: hypothetical protein COA36_06560 [Desulfotalea sp.]|nr:MAG: hypothetical protein COA36_06560 [Desulfotalea sp.]
MSGNGTFSLNETAQQITALGFELKAHRVCLSARFFLLSTQTPSERLQINGPIYHILVSKQ